jgi:hypothetical protein
VVHSAVQIWLATVNYLADVPAFSLYR